MKVRVNGEPREVSAQTIATLVTELELIPAATLVEHNGDALRREEWSARVLRDDDQIELVRIVAGG